MFSISITACLLTIGWCLILLRRLKEKRIRLLVGFLGLMCACQGMRQLREAGIWTQPEVHALVNVIDLVVTVLCFISLIVLRLHHAEHRSTKVRLRLVDEPKNASPSFLPVTAASPLPH
jgi:hypothetical protein